MKTRQNCRKESPTNGSRLGAYLYFGGQMQLVEGRFVQLLVGLRPSEKPAPLLGEKRLAFRYLHLL